MTLQELLALATTTLAHVPHHPAVTPELCAAICWRESSGNIAASGDDGAALGLAQFHADTWERFSAYFGCRQHRNPQRACPDCTMRALVAELSHAWERSKALRISQHVRLKGSDAIRLMCNFHNLGHLSESHTAYARKVAKLIVDMRGHWIAAPKPGARRLPRSSEPTAEAVGRAAAAKPSAARSGAVKAKRPRGQHTAAHPWKRSTGGFSTPTRPRRKPITPTHKAPATSH